MPEATVALDDEDNLVAKEQAKFWLCAEHADESGLPVGYIL